MHTGEWQMGELADDVRPLVRPVAWRALTVRALKEVWRFLRAWMFLIYGWLLLNTELTNFEPARPDLAYTAFFPMAVFALFYTVRSLKAPDVVNRGAMLTVTVGLAVVLPVLNVA